MKKYRPIIILLNLLLLLFFFNKSIVEKEQILANSQLILLKLIPVDPRSYMQGDYMDLRYDMARNIDENIPKRGYCVVTLDEDNVAQKVRIQKDKTPIYKGEYLIEYTKKNRSRINIGTESFFFQEGEADKYEEATYGALKVDKNGSSILVGLYDIDKVKIE